MDGQTHISKYAIMQRLGTGGMAEVFKCRLAGIGGFDKIVVIKRILPHLLEDESFVGMFLDEARIAANLTHPNIVQVFEIAQDNDGTPYIAMEFVRGPTLAQIIRKAAKLNDLQIGKMAKLIAGAALGLDYAHNARGSDGTALNIVHRDISPQNILVSLDGVPKILDFGVAKADGRITHTQGGVLKGKVRFMAPEMVLSADGSIDRRADVFSLGVCLYLSTTGQLPFSGNNDVAIMQAITSGQYKKPSERIPGFPVELEDIIAWTMAVNPADRCPDCRELSDRLNAWVSANPAGNSEQDLAAWLMLLYPEMESESWGGGAVTPSGVSKALGTGPRPSQPRATGSQPALRPPTNPGLRAMTNPGLRMGSTPGQGRTGMNSALQAPLISDGAIQVDMGAASPASRTPLIIGGVVAFIAVLIAVVTIVLKPAPVPVAVAVPPVATNVVTPPPAASARPYIEEAQKLITSGKLARAIEQIKRARAMPNLGPAEDVELTKLEGDIHLAQWLDAAARAVESGSLDEARKSLQQVDEEDPENAKAKAIRESIKEKQAKIDEAKTPVMPVAKQGGRPVAVAAAQKPSPLSVTSEPAGATVYVDGDPVGTTPLNGFPLRPGAHTVEVGKKGFQRKSESVTSAGKPLALKVTLSAADGPAPAPPPPPPEEKPRLKVASSVAVQLSIDGVAAGPAPFDSEALKPGRHTITASAEGYQTGTQEVTLSAGDTKSISFDLQKVAVAKAPTKEPDVVTPTPKAGPAPPKLPRSFTAHTMQDLGGAFRGVEAEAVKSGGMALAQVRGTTGMLANELAGKMSPGDAFELFPTGMYWFIVHGAQAGKSPQQIAKELKSAHFAGELADLTQ